MHATIIVINNVAKKTSKPSTPILTLPLPLMKWFVTETTKKCLILYIYFFYIFFLYIYIFFIFLRNREKKMVSVTKWAETPVFKPFFVLHFLTTLLHKLFFCNKNGTGFDTVLHKLSVTERENG